MVLLGAASREMPFEDGQWHHVIENNVKPKFIGLNKKAFTRGQEVQG